MNVVPEITATVVPGGPNAAVPVTPLALDFLDDEEVSTFVPTLIVTGSGNDTAVTTRTEIIELEDESTLAATVVETLSISVEIVETLDGWHYTETVTAGYSIQYDNTVESGTTDYIFSAWSNGDGEGFVFTSTSSSKFSHEETTNDESIDIGAISVSCSSISLVVDTNTGELRYDETYGYESTVSVEIESDEIQYRCTETYAESTSSSLSVEKIGSTVFQTTLLGFESASYRAEESGASSSDDISLLGETTGTITNFHASGRFRAEIEENYFMQYEIVSLEELVGTVTNGVVEWEMELVELTGDYEVSTSSRTDWDESASMSYHEDQQDASYEYGWSDRSFGKSLGEASWQGELDETGEWVLVEGGSTLGGEEESVSEFSGRVIGEGTDILTDDTSTTTTEYSVIGTSTETVSFQESYKIIENVIDGEWTVSSGLVESKSHYNGTDRIIVDGTAELTAEDENTSWTFNSDSIEYAGGSATLRSEYGNDEWSTSGTRNENYSFCEDERFMAETDVYDRVVGDMTISGHSGYIERVWIEMFLGTEYEWVDEDWEMTDGSGFGKNIREEGVYWDGEGEFVQYFDTSNNMETGALEVSLSGQEQGQAGVSGYVWEFGFETEGYGLEYSLDWDGEDWQVYGNGNDLATSSRLLRYGYEASGQSEGFSVSYGGEGNEWQSIVVVYDSELEKADSGTARVSGEESTWLKVGEGSYASADFDGDSEAPTSAGSGSGSSYTWGYEGLFVLAYDDEDERNLTPITGSAGWQSSDPEEPRDEDAEKVWKIAWLKIWDDSQSYSGITTEGNNGAYSRLFTTVESKGNTQEGNGNGAAMFGSSGAEAANSSEDGTSDIVGVTARANMNAGSSNAGSGGEADWNVPCSNGKSVVRNTWDTNDEYGTTLKGRQKITTEVSDDKATQNSEYDNTQTHTHATRRDRTHENVKHTLERERDANGNWVIVTGTGTQSGDRNSEIINHPSATGSYSDNYSGTLAYDAVNDSWYLSGGSGQGSGRGELNYTEVLPYEFGPTTYDVTNTMNSTTETEASFEVVDGAWKFNWDRLDFTSESKSQADYDISYEYYTDYGISCNFSEHMSWDNTVKRTHRTTPTSGVGQLEIETENRGTRHTTIYEGGELLSEDDIQSNVSWISREGTYDGVWVQEYVERSRDDRGTMYSGGATIEFQHGLTLEESWFTVTYGDHAEHGSEFCPCWEGTGYWYGITGAYHGAPPAVCVGMEARPTDSLPIPAIGSTPTAPAGIVVTPSTIANSVCLPARQGVFSGRNRLNVEGVTKSNLFDTSHEDDPLGPKKPCRVLQTYENGLQNIVKLYLKVVETGREFFVRTSVGHRLYVLDHGFEHAQDVPIGARMINYNQQVVEVLAVELEPEPELVYNFEVEDAHTYFVGDDAECCVLGHNQDCGNIQNPIVPEKIKEPPERLKGKWLISIFAQHEGGVLSKENGHAWIAFHQLDERNRWTGVVHTVGVAKATYMGHDVSGTHWDLGSELADIHNVNKSKAGIVVSRSMIINNPKIITNPKYNTFFNNCASYAAATWKLNTGEAFIGYGHSITPASLKADIIDFPAPPNKRPLKPGEYPSKTRNYTPMTVEFPLTPYIPTPPRPKTITLD